MFGYTGNLYEFLRYGTVQVHITNACQVPLWMVQDPIFYESGNAVEPYSSTETRQGNAVALHPPALQLDTLQVSR